jgi:hypothetical protein
VRKFDPFERPELLSRTSRARQISRLRAVYEGKQYDGRANWWTGLPSASGQPVPLRERKPCIRYKLAQAATLQVVRFLFGDGRFPMVAAKPVDPSASLNGSGLGEDDAAVVSAWIGEAIETCSVKPLMRELAKTAISSRTAVAVFEVIEGRFDVTQPAPQHCHAEFRNGDPDSDVVRLLWCYEFDAEELAPDGKTLVTKRHIFRREWDEVGVHVYEPAPVEPGQPIQWGTPEFTAHGFDFCPVVWIRNQTSGTSGIDGVSLYEDQEEHLEALDITLSRRHQGLVYLGSPQVYETGVEDGDGPSAEGRKANHVGFGADHGGPHGTVAAPARKSGPEVVWRYNGKDVKVEMLETTGKAFEVASLHVSDMRSRFLEEIGVVLTSMADTVSRVTAGAEMSAKFLALAHAPLLGLVQEYRDTWWPMGVRRVIEMMMRITLSIESRGERVLILGSEDLASVLPRFATTGWMCPPLEAKWGQFFSPSSQETQASVEATTKAMDGGLISHQTAVEAVAHEFGVDDVSREIEEIEAERVRRDGAALMLEAQRNAATHDLLRGIDAETDSPDSARPIVRSGARGDDRQRGGGSREAEGDDSSLNRPV